MKAIDVSRALKNEPRIQRNELMQWVAFMGATLLPWKDQTPQDGEGLVFRSPWHILGFPLTLIITPAVACEEGEPYYSLYGLSEAAMEAQGYVNYNLIACGRKASSEAPKELFAKLQQIARMPCRIPTLEMLRMNEDGTVNPGVGNSDKDSDEFKHARIRAVFKHWVKLLIDRNLEYHFEEDPADFTPIGGDGSPSYNERECITLRAIVATAELHNIDLCTLWAELQDEALNSIVDQWFYHPQGLVMGGGVDGYTEDDNA